MLCWTTKVTVRRVQLRTARSCCRDVAVGTSTTTTTHSADIHHHVTTSTRTTTTTTRSSYLCRCKCSAGCCWIRKKMMMCNKWWCTCLCEGGELWSVLLRCVHIRV